MSSLSQAIKLLDPMVNGGDDGSFLADNYTKLNQVLEILKQLNAPQATLEAARGVNTSTAVKDLLAKCDPRTDADKDRDYFSAWTGQNVGGDAAQSAEQMGPKLTLEDLIAQAAVRNSPAAALAILEGWSERLKAVVNRYAPKVPDEPEHAIDRSIKLVEEMLVQPSYDPALDFVRKTLESVKTTRGYESLGTPGHVVVCDSTGLTDDIVDSLNGFMIAYGTGQHDCKSLRLQAALAGDQAMNVLPKWFAQTYGHVSKGGFTALCYHVLIESQVNPRFKEPVNLLSLVELETIELQMIAGDKQALTKALEPK